MSFADFGTFAVFLILVLMGLFSLFAIATSIFSKGGIRDSWQAWVEKWSTETPEKDTQ
jgi:hypothetical protein